MEDAKKALWKESSFLKYYLFNSFNYFGSGMSVVALPMYVYALTESSFYTSLVAAFSGLPYLLFGLFAGAVADRGNRKRIMIGCSAASGVVLATIPAVSVLAGSATAFHVLAAGLFVSSAFVWFDSASHGVLLQLVGRDRLVAANSLLTSTDTIIRIGSPAIAGFVIYHFGTAWAIGIDAACYFIASLLIFSIRGMFQTEQKSRLHANKTLLRRIGSDIKEGLSFIWSEALVRSLTLLGFGNSFIGGAVTGLLVVFGTQVLDFNSAPQMSLLFTFGSIGALAASLSLPILRKTFKPGQITLAGLLLNAASLLIISMGGPLATVYASYVIWNLSNILVIINGITLRQELTPYSLQARVHASGRMIAWGGYPFGSFLSGFASEVIGVQSVYVGLGMLMMLLFGLALITPLRHYEIKRAKEKAM